MNFDVKSVTKSAYWVIAVSVGVFLVVEGLVLFSNKGDSARKIAYMQRLAGILPDEFVFDTCRIKVDQSSFISAVQYTNGGLIWSYGVLPQLTTSKPLSSKFYLLSSAHNKQDVAINWIDDDNKKNIILGKNNCLSSGTCKEVLNALNSKVTGITIGADLPLTLLVPEIGLSATYFSNDVSWMRCQN